MKRHNEMNTNQMDHSHVDEIEGKNQSQAKQLGIFSRLLGNCAEMSFDETLASNQVT